MSRDCWQKKQVWCTCSLASRPHPSVSGLVMTVCACVEITRKPGKNGVLFVYVAYRACLLLASPPGHSPKAERWPGTDCLRMLQNYTKTGVISKTPCTFREIVRARLDIRPFQFTSTMTSATVTATDTFNDAVKYALERVGKAGMVLLVRNITATQSVLSVTT